MAKALCISGILIAVLILIVFLIDLVAALAGFVAFAPFRGASRMMDIVFILCAAGLAFLAWSTLKEQT
jgi:hypothetical protein